MGSTGAGLTVCSRSQIALPSHCSKVRCCGYKTLHSAPQKVPQQVVDVGRNDWWRLVLCSSRRLFHWFARIVGGHGTEEGQGREDEFVVSCYILWFASFFFVWLIFLIFEWLCFLPLCMVCAALCMVCGYA